MVESGLRRGKKSQVQELGLGGIHRPPFLSGSFLWIRADKGIWSRTVSPTEQAQDEPPHWLTLDKPTCSL